MAENPPAFPCEWIDPEDFETVKHRGMSLRDWFAGRALMGMVASIDYQIAARKVAREAGRSVEAEIAEAAYSFAAAMLAQREHGQ